LKAIPMRADTGPIGGDLSHEFIILAETGESEVFCDQALIDMAPPGRGLDFDADLRAHVEQRTQYYAATKEMHDPAAFGAIPEDRQVSARGIEVGHIFSFGTKYSEPMGATVQNSDGEIVPVHMGSYGIGVSRLVGGIVEASHDENGIIWPRSVAPFEAGVISMKPDDEAVAGVADAAYAKLTQAGLEVLYDETAERAGPKFGRMELIGLPWQVTIGPRGVKEGKVELKRRASGEKEDVSLDDAISRIVAG
ncbi:MAG: His/Gly/Thr/Pro-type tRNA ligase C-terminal domain-containing protein, partial [Pseudomonadota bacterium]